MDHSFNFIGGSDLWWRHSLLRFHIDPTGGIEGRAFGAKQSGNGYLPLSKVVPWVISTPWGAYLHDNNVILVHYRLLRLVLIVRRT